MKILDGDSKDFNEADKGVFEDNARSTETSDYLYDSDSSDERSKKSKQDMNMIRPFELPLVAMYQVESNDDDLLLPDKVVSLNAFNTTNRESKSSTERLPSVFADAISKIDNNDGDNSWFIVQLPTRLPPMESNFDNENPGEISGNATNIDENIIEKKEKSPAKDSNIMHNISSVAIPPIITNNFDNALCSVAPGKVGKIVAYKSGKTVLVIERSGPKKVHMDVSEGLSSAFHQEAVSINIDKSNYVSLGTVTKTLVVSPDLECWV